MSEIFDYTVNVAESDVLSRYKLLKEYNQLDCLNNNVFYSNYFYRSLDLEELTWIIMQLCSHSRNGHERFWKHQLGDANRVGRILENVHELLPELLAMQRMEKIDNPLAGIINLKRLELYLRAKVPKQIWNRIE